MPRGIQTQWRCALRKTPLPIGLKSECQYFFKENQNKMQMYVYSDDPNYIDICFELIGNRQQYLLLKYLFDLQTVLIGKRFINVPKKYLLF